MNKINHHLTMRPRMVAPVSRHFYGRRGDCGGLPQLK
jgi:hypothetical protein